MLVITLMTSGCGISSVNEEKYTVSTSLHQVVDAHHQRSQEVALIQGVLASKDLVHKPFLVELGTAQTSLSMVREKALNDQSNELVNDLNSRLNLLVAAENNIVGIAKQVVSSSNPKLSETQLSILKEQIQTDKVLMDAVKAARTKFLVNVRSYNEIISIFPTSITALILNEDKKIALSVDGVYSGEGVTGSLIESAIKPKQ